MSENGRRTNYVHKPIFLFSSLEGWGETSKFRVCISLCLFQRHVDFDQGRGWFANLCKIQKSNTHLLTTSVPEIVFLQNRKNKQKTIKKPNPDKFNTQNKRELSSTPKQESMS